MIECTTDSRVSDDRSEDVRAVDFLPLPGALAEHVGRVWVVLGGSAGGHRVPQQLEDGWVDS